MPDRYAQAVTARRAELRAQQRLLGPGVRAELRDALVLVRAESAAAAATAFADLRQEIDAHLERGPGPPSLVGPAVAAIEEQVHARWVDEARAAMLRVALHRELPVLPPVPGREPGSAPGRPLPRPVRVVDVLADAGAWRLAVLPLVVAPLTGPAGLPVLLPAVGLGVLVLVTVVRARRTAAEQARVRRWCGEVLADSRARIDAELDVRTRLLLARAAPRFDAALAGRLRAVTAELALLAPEVSDAAT